MAVSVNCGSFLWASRSRLGPYYLGSRLEIRAVIFGNSHLRLLASVGACEHWGRPGQDLDLRPKALN